MPEPFTVTVSAPARGRSARAVRAVVASLAVDAGMDIDEIDDVRVATQEAVALLVGDPGARGPLVATVTHDADHLVIELEREATGEPPRPRGLAAELLGALVASCDVTADGGRHRVRMVSHPPAHPDPVPVDRSVG